MIKTPCCKVDYEVKGRAHYICTKCKEDVTLHVLLVTQALGEKKKKKK